MFCAQTTLLELSFTAIVFSFPNPERLRQLEKKQKTRKKKKTGSIKAELITREEAACGGRANGAGAARPSPSPLPLLDKVNIQDQRAETQMWCSQKSYFYHDARS